MRAVSFSEGNPTKFRPNLPSANWTYLAGNPCRKRKFWPDHLWIRPSFPRPQTIRWMSNMRWISSPNSYQNIEICSKHSWKKGPFNWHSLRLPIIMTQTNQIWVSVRLSKKEDRKKDVVQTTEVNAGTMHLTKRHVVLTSVIALFRFAPTVLLVRKLLTRVAITKILFTTNPHADQPGHSDYHILQYKTCNDNYILPFPESKNQKKLPLLVGPFSSLYQMSFKLSMATKSTDLHKQIKIWHLHNLLSENWTYLAGNPCRKRKFWPDHLWIRPSFPRPQTIRWMSNMRWISSPNSYRNTEICSKHSWKKGPFNWHSPRPKQIKFGLLSEFLKKKKRDDHDVVNKERNAGTMHLTKRHVVLTSVIALFRFAPTVLLVRKLLTWVANHKESLHNPSSCTPTRTFRLPHTLLQNMQWEFVPLPKSKKEKKLPL